MDARRWERVNELFEAAIARRVDERATFIAEECGDDRELESRVCRLVRAHERSVGFLEKPVDAKALRLLASPGLSPAMELPFRAFRAGTEFRGTDRFAVRRQLGAGGMGVVYEVHDSLRNELVALKTLRRAHAADLYRLKREFRSLADIAHPNLVSLYELVVEPTACFFTMELVDGVTLIDFLRDTAAPPRRRYEQVRRVFRQLVDGIRALHRNGKLHRDIKPSNVLITPAERVVILDFGLASDLVSDAAATDERMAGTPAYLAPERQPGTAPTESEDWYSVGVTLYVALTGRAPFEGPFEEVRRRKRESVPLAPATIVSDIPEDLNAICTGLLRSDPRQRLTGRQTAQMLELERASATDDTSPFELEPEATFVGRQPQLDTLESALAAAKRGRATTVYVHGPSGIGKSALVQHFLDGVESREDIVVLRGRCYEREAVPYKALDGVVDSLSQYLRTLPQLELDVLLPPSAAALFRLFPVMLQVGMAASGLRRDSEEADPITLRDRAFGALRELLTAMAVQRPLVIAIDDLHWADDDSAALLEELLRPPQAPPILTIICFRAEEVEFKPFLHKLLERTTNEPAVSLPLEPMAGDEVRALVASALDAAPTVSASDLRRLAESAGGNPFLLRQLASYLATRRVGSGRVTFAGMLDERLRTLPVGARRFLETLAICGRAMSPEVVHEAAGLVGDERRLVARLQADHFVRASGTASRIELYHDRIRETIAAGVSPDDRRELHRLLARTLVSRRADDPDALFEHYREAGNHEEASVQAALAAGKADAALAFDRAAAYYGAALELAPQAESRADWKVLMAAALANAGRPAAAADAYLDAAQAVEHARRVELQRIAAEQLLIGGHTDRGLEVIRAVLGSVNLRFPSTARTALASVAWRRVRLRWRGHAFVERGVDGVPAEELLRVDTCWSVATGMAMVDNLPAADFQSRHLLLALDQGEPYRVARALAAEVFFLASLGGPRRQQAHDWATRAEAAALRAAHPHAIAVCALARTVAAFCVGEWRETQAHGQRALDLLKDLSGASTWEKSSAQILRLAGVLFQGELRQGTREVLALLASARGRGNLYFETELRTRMNLVWLAADEPDEGLREASDAIRQWSHSGFYRQHYNFMLDQIQTELYRGRARDAWEVIEKNWAALQRTYLLRIQFLRIEASYLRARCALLMAASGQDRRRFLAIARRDAHLIRHEDMSWSNPLASLLFAAIAHLEGKPDIARDRLAEAASGFERAHMQLYLAVARRRIGELACNDVNRALGRQGDEWMAAQGVVSPPRIARLIAPGFDRRV